MNPDQPQQVLLDGGSLYRLTACANPHHHAEEILRLATYFAERYGDSHRVWAWDSPAPPMVEPLTQCLGFMGYQVLWPRGEAAANIIASLGNAALSQLIVTCDEDLQALAAPNRSVLVYDREAQGWAVLTAADICRRWQVTEPALIWDVQAWSGNPARRVAGVPGVDLRTAHELVERFGPVNVVIRLELLPPELLPYQPHFTELQYAYCRNRPNHRLNLPVLSAVTDRTRAAQAREDLFAGLDNPFDHPHTN